MRLTSHFRPLDQKYAMTGSASRLSLALAMAEEVHEGVGRKGSDIPYLAHVVAVVALVKEFGGNENEASTGLLHDTIEDGGDPTAIRTQIERTKRMGWIDRRLGKHVHDMRVAADALEHAAVAHPDLEGLRGMAAQCSIGASRIEARQSSTGQMHDAQAVAREEFVQWASRYPRELIAYAASLDDPKDARLIRSMVPRSPR